MAKLSTYTAKTTPVDADLFPLTDSAASNNTKNVTWANIKATLATWLGFTPASSSGPASLNFYEDTDNGTNKGTLIAPASMAADRTWTLPNATGTLLNSTDIDTDSAFSTNSDSLVPSQKAVKTGIAAAVVGLLDDKGNQDCSGNPNYPAASKGDIYTVSVAGKIGGASGITVEIGDTFRALADNAGGTQASVGTSWSVLQANLVGALVSGGALGTPSSGTLTNCSGLPAANAVNTPAGRIAATDVQAAINELDGEKVNGTPGVKVHRGIWSQTGTSTPTIDTELENSLGGTPTIGRTSAGVYTVTLTGAFPSAKVFVEYARGTGSTVTYFKWTRTSNDVLTFTTVANNNVAAEWNMAAASIAILVYP